jgi:adenylate cyclase
MPADVETDSGLKIAHVLFIDIVGYSKRLINEQSALVKKLNDLVRQTEQCRNADAAGKLIRIPTGDGMALAFFTTPDAPVRCAIELSKADQADPTVELRMGIHSGPVDQLSDVNERSNLAGAGINMAQRIMDCGDAGHILLSQRVADDLGQYGRWQSHLHDLGEVAVKHGVQLRLFNFDGDGYGNPAIPSKLIASLDLARRSRWKRIGAIAGAVALLSLAAGVWFLRVKNESGGAAAQRREKSIAVLPFENLSHDPENAYFADGIQEEILTRLAKIADLKVISRTSTARYKSSPDNLREIARQLGVAHVLEGSVQRANDQVRINVQLIKAEDDSHLWADTYDRKLIDVFKIESEIAKAIADNLKARLTGTEQHAIASRPTENAEAHQLYLKAHYLFNKWTGADMAKAAELFQQAIDKDPNYALAYAGLSGCLVWEPYFSTMRPQSMLPQAEAAARKALQIDDDLPEAHNALGEVLLEYYIDLQRAGEEFQRAIQLNPNYSDARQNYSNGPLLATGQFEAAISEGKRAIELDPLSLFASACLAWDYLAARSYDESARQFRKTLELDESYYFGHLGLAHALEMKGETNEAIAELNKAMTLGDETNPLAHLGYTFARLGKQAEARAILTKLTEMAKTRYVLEYNLALVHIGLGENDVAITLFETAYREHAGGNLVHLKVDPFLDPLRGNPRFETLVTKVLAPKAPNSQPVSQ